MEDWLIIVPNPAKRNGHKDIRTISGDIHRRAGQPDLAI
jgi:hypothetical protein